MSTRANKRTYILVRICLQTNIYLLTSMCVRVCLCDGPYYLTTHKRMQESGNKMKMENIKTQKQRAKKDTGVKGNCNGNKFTNVIIIFRNRVGWQGYVIK